MMRVKNLLLVIVFSLFISLLSKAQDLPVIIQAEQGIKGSDFRVVDTLGTTAVTINSDVVNSYYPGNANRVITYEVTFPEAGTYDLFARVLVGRGTYDDDSYFYGNGFGEKNVTLDADWIRANGLAVKGYTGIFDVVNGSGAAGSGIWKWVNMSELTGDETPVSFQVEQENLTQTFQIGAREDGFYIDKFLFGKADLYFTVSNLNKGEPGTVLPPAEMPPGTPIAAGQSKFLGSEWDYNQAPNFASYWNQMTPGNAGKWGSVEYTRDVMDWTVLDSTYNVSRRYKMPFKEHTLIWGAQQPSWIGALDSAQQRQEIEEWYAALADRYDSIEYIDVVNEPIHNAPNGMVPWGTTVPNVNYAGALGGAGVTGWDWIITAFRLARQYFPDSKLILNEYSVINSLSTTQQYIEIIDLLKAENLIDGIGEQGHAFTTYGVPAATLKSNLDLLAETNIPIYITELDIDGLTDLAQLKEYQRVFPIFWEHPAVEGITLWGYRYGVWRQEQGAYLITADNTERPAMTWLKAYVNDTLTLTGNIEVTSADGSDFLYKGDAVQMNALVTPANTTIPNVTWSVSPANQASINASGLLTALNPGTVTVVATAWDGSGVTGSKTMTIAN
ncbi:MAG: endo-1,4-beta-xylanase, partial [Bacteroidales bacterium]|nr:endo-1,4-beta-xylanase [Bacteroidales bacterium]